MSELITFPSQYLHYGVSELTYTTNLGELQEKVFLAEAVPTAEEL